MVFSVTASLVALDVVCFFLGLTGNLPFVTDFLGAIALPLRARVAKNIFIVEIAG
jgi:hypothetical protein